MRPDAVPRTAAAPRAADLRLLVRREASAWWGTRAWWMHLLVYALFVAGLGAGALWQVTRGAVEATAAVPMEGFVPFFVFHLMFVGGGAILTAQGAIVGEVQRGTAAWILSKPVSREAFVLAKALGLGSGFAVVGVAAPLALMVPAWSALGATLDPGRLLLAAVGLLLVVAFFLSLTLLLGTLLSSRAGVAGSAFMVLFVATQFAQSLPQLLPTGIPFLLAEVLHGGTFGSPLPLVVTAAASGAFLWLACRRFARMEL